MEAHNKKSWPAITIRAFAVLNLLMGLVGFSWLLTSVTTTLTQDPWSQDPRYYAQAYYIRSAINLVFVVLTIWGGIYLWRLHRRGWTICKTLFTAETAYFVLDTAHVALLMGMGKLASVGSMAIGASAGTGEMGTVLQTITGYPVIALIVLKIAYGKLRQARPSTEESAGATSSVELRP